MAQQITIDIVAETKKLTQGLNDANDQIGGLNKQVAGLAKAATAAASAFVLKQGITFLKQGIDEAKDAAVAMRQATTTFGAGSDALKKITADAEKFGKQLAVDNDDIIKMSTSLGSRLPKDLQASSAELVKTFLDVQAFTGGAIDAEAASNKLAKAFADGGLKAGELNKIFPGLNQSIYDQAEALSKAGKNQEAINLLLTQGAKVYQDAAAKNATSTQKFEVALANFKEELGTRVLPVLEKLLGFLTDLLDAFSKQPKALQNIELALLAIVGIGGPLLSFISNTKTAMVNLGLLTAAEEGATVATTIFSTALKAIPIMAVIALIVLLITHWDDVKKATTAVWEKVKETWDAIYNKIKDAANAAIDWLKENWPLILGVLTGPFGLFVAFLVKHKDEIVTKLTETWDAAKAVVSEKVEAIFGTVIGWFYAIKDYIVGEDGIIVKLTNSLAYLWGEIGKLITGIVEGIKNGIVNTWNALKDKTTEVFTGIQKKASEIWNNIKDYIVGVVTNVVEKFNEVRGKMVEVGKDIARGIIDGLLNIRGWFVDKLTKWINDNIPSVIRNVLQISSPSKVMAQIGEYAVEGLYQGMGIKGPVGIQMPQLNVAGGGAGAVNITINAGVGTDPYALGRTVQQALSKYGKITV